MDSLRFSRRSWHYWLYSRNIFFLRGHRRGAKNLCNYFWSIVGIVVGNLLLIAALLGVLVFLVVNLWLHPVIILYALGTLAGLGVFFGAVWFGGNWWDNRRWQPKKEKQPNLLFEYIKTKKKKYCPMIEWQD